MPNTCTLGAKTRTSYGHTSVRQHGLAFTLGRMAWKQVQEMKKRQIPFKVQGKGKEEEHGKGPEPTTPAEGPAGPPSQT